MGQFLKQKQNSVKIYFIHSISIYEQNAFKFLPVAYQHLYEEKEDNG